MKRWAWGGVVLALLIATGCGRWRFGGGGGGSSEPEGGDVVTVTVQNPDGPLQGIVVVFHDSAGEVLGTVATDVNGQAWWKSRGESMVTIADYGGNSYLERHFGAKTITGLRPGDSVVFGNVTDPWAGSQSVAVTFPEGFVGATDYEVYTGCDSDSTGAWDNTVNVATGVGCTRAGEELSLLALAVDTDGNILATSSVSGLARDVGNVEMPAWSAPTLTDVNVELTGLPSDATRASVKVSSFWQANSFCSGKTSSNDLTGGGLNGSVQLVDDLLDARRVQVSVDYENEPDLDSPTAYIDSLQLGTDASVAVDGSVLLPVIRSVELEFTGERPTIVITSDASLDAADHRMTALEWTDQVGDYYEWLFLHPAGSDRVTIPKMPKEFANYLPLESDMVDTLQTAAFDYDFVDTYRQMVATYAFELFLWEFWYVPAKDGYSFVATAGPGGFKRLK